MSPFLDRLAVVTGGSGFIGSNLTLRLVDLGCRVVVVDNFQRGLGGNLFNLNSVSDKIELLRQDMGQPGPLVQRLREANFLFNLAGNTSHLDSIADPLADMNMNLVAHLRLLEAVRESNPGVTVIYAGTRQVFGKVEPPATEQLQARPVDINGVHKLAAEQYHLLYHQLFGIKAACLRLTNTYGPRQLIAHPRHSFLGWFLNRAVLKQEIEIYGGAQTRDFNHVEDVCDALLLAASNQNAIGKTWLLGGERATVGAAAELIADLSGVRVREAPFPKARESIEIGDYYGDYSAFQKATGWRPKTPFASGIASTLEYFQANKQHYLESPND
jgi:UDP-glucose 4-epimerase